MNSSPVPPPEESGGGAGLPTNRKAQASIVLGVAGFLCLFVFPFGAFALGIPSITTSLHARREIEASKGEQDGANLAACGLIIGGVGLIFGIIALGLDFVVWFPTIR